VFLGRARSTESAAASGASGRAFAKSDRHACAEGVDCGAKMPGVGLEALPTSTGQLGARSVQLGGSASGVLRVASGVLRVASGVLRSEAGGEQGGAGERRGGRMLVVGLGRRGDRDVGSRWRDGWRCAAGRLMAARSLFAQHRHEAPCALASQLGA
jgi:hypothetical protein